MDFTDVYIHEATSNQMIMNQSIQKKKNVDVTDRSLQGSTLRMMPNQLKGSQMDALIQT